MSKVIISIQYAGLLLPIARNANGEDVTPLKPLSDLFGLKWETQRAKVMENQYTRSYLGACVLSMPVPTAPLIQEDDKGTPLGGGGLGQIQPQTCIRLDRVGAYMMTVQPERVRASGNETGANYLIKKQAEWADTLHDYEQLGVAVNLQHAKVQDALRKQRASFAQMVGVKNRTADLGDRRALSHLLAQMAGELAMPYSSDLIDGPGAGEPGAKA